MECWRRWNYRRFLPFLFIVRTTDLAIYEVMTNARSWLFVSVFSG